MITSKANARVKYIKSLRKNTARKKADEYLIEGEREISRAKVISEVYYYEKSVLIQKLVQKGVSCTQVSKDVLQAISVREEAVAIAKKQEKTVKDLKGKFYIALESVEKPGNLGAILRSCDGAGVDGVLLVDSLVDQFHPNVIRASLGAFFSLDIVSCSKKEAFAFIAENKIKLVVSSPDATKAYTEKDLNFPLMIAMGSEDKGLSDSWFEYETVKIPMRGICDSLNVSVATAVIMYEALRQNEC